MDLVKIRANGSVRLRSRSGGLTVIRLMTEVRLGGTIQFARVVDETRRVRVTQTFDHLEDAVAHARYSTGARSGREPPSPPWRI